LPVLITDESGSSEETMTKTTLITGAGSGIGAATAATLIAKGHRVICSGRRLQPLEALCQRLGKTALPLQLDVTDDASVTTLHERLPQDWQEIDILINNAGHDRGGRRRFDQGSTADWISIMETNVNGLIRITRKVIDGMLQRGRGDIVNIGSTAGLRPYAGGTIYAGSKHAVHGFSEALRLDYAGSGIRVIEILPGLVRTEFAATRFSDTERGEEYYASADGTLAAEDVARTIVFALEQPPQVLISQLVVLPSAQR
jgi:NADP-dependent 3-hydroxy acid dehydrogenase YdfG